MSHNNRYGPKGNTLCKYCQQWIRDTPSEQKRHERSKHHIKNLQEHIRNKQAKERDEQKEHNRNRKILDNIERHVNKKPSADESSNTYYQQYLKHQEEMQKDIGMPNPMQLLASMMGGNDANKQQAPPSSSHTKHYEEDQEAYECNDMPLGAHLETISSSSTPISDMPSSKQSEKKKKQSSAPTEIGSYYDDPNYFYYDHDEEEEPKSTETASEEIKPEEEAPKKPKPPSTWKNKYVDSHSTAASQFGQWEVVSVSKREEVKPTSEASPQGNFTTKEEEDDDKKTTHEEDALGGDYSLKKRKFEMALPNDPKRVKQEGSNATPKKPTISFSLGKKK